MKKYWKLLTLLVAGLLLVAGADAAMAQTESPSEAEWYVRYWNNTDQVGQPVLERNEVDVNHDWGLGSPDDAVNRNGFSAQWTSPVHFEAGTYRFTLSSDDGARVWLDDGYIIDSWTRRTMEDTDVAVVTLDEGVHNIAVDYFEDAGFAAISFDWQRVGDEGDDTDDETNVTIDPRSGPVGAEVSVRATGFTPDSTVTVGIGRAQSETTTSFETTVPADGILQTSITVPEGADVGDPWRVLILGEGDERALSDDFIITAGDEEAGTCGPTYVVQPGEWLHRIARACDTTVDAILALNPNIQEPNNIPAGLNLNMPVGDEDATEPNVTITPRSGTPGTTITANITGFAPNEEISVALREPGELPQSGFPITTDDAGSAQVSIELPDEVQTGETWHVLVRSDERNAESDAFVVTSAADGTVMVTPRYNLNLRSGPGTDFDDLDTVPAGTTLEAFERSPDGNWVRVQYNNTDGWIAAWLADISEGTLEAVPLQDSDE